MWEQIRANRRRSFVLAVFMAGILVALGYFLAEYFAPGSGVAGILLACVVWVVMALAAYYGGDQVFLSMAKARRIQKRDLPRLYNIVEEMTIASGLGKMPAVYVIDDPAPNAFATGRNPQHAAVAVTSGLLRLCSRDELQGIIAHEIGHIRNRDVLLMLFAGVMVGAIAILAEVGLRSHWFLGGRSRRSSSGGGGQAQAVIVLVAIALMILAPLIAQLVYFAISRKREYLADASAARYTRYPEGLASALEKIAAAPAKLASASRITAPMYIVNPLKREGSRAANLTSTHPPISERVQILRAMGGASYAAYERAYRQSQRRRTGVMPPSVLKEQEEIELRPAAGLERAMGPAGDLFAPGIAMAVTHDVASTVKDTADPGVRAASVVPREARPDMAKDAAKDTAKETAEDTAKEAAKDTAAAAAKRRAREVDDFFYRQEAYRELNCSCGTLLKIPPGFLATRINCPHCNRPHDTGSFREMAAPR